MFPCFFGGLSNPRAEKYSERSSQFLRTSNFVRHPSTRSFKHTREDRDVNISCSVRSNVLYGKFPVL